MEPKRPVLGALGCGAKILLVLEFVDASGCDAIVEPNKGLLPFS